MTMFRVQVSLGQNSFHDNINMLSVFSTMLTFATMVQEMVVKLNTSAPAEPMASN